jgi:hypothetical protein
MKKGKISTFCGNEFTVFYLKEAVEEDNRKAHLNQYADPDHPLNKHDDGAKYNCTSYTLSDKLMNLKNLNWMDVNENSAGGGEHGFSLNDNHENN